MSWTVTKEEGSVPVVIAGGAQVGTSAIPAKLNVRAIIDLDNEQAEIKELIASLQKHVKSDE